MSSSSTAAAAAAGSNSASGDNATTAEVLTTILAELRQLKQSHDQLERRIDGMNLNNSGHNVSDHGHSPIANNNNNNAGGGLVQPIPIRPSPGGGGGGENVGGGHGALSPGSMSPPGMMLGGGASPIGSPGAAAGFLARSRKGSSSVDVSAKEEFRNWSSRNATPSGFGNASANVQSSNGGSPTTATTSGLSYALSERMVYPSRAVLTTYPGQVGIKPIPLVWGAKTPEERGPILASRQKASLGLRNAIGAYGGAYSIYHALSVAIGALDPNQRPDYTNTEPTFDVKPNPNWFDATKIVTIDPWGHLAQVVFKKEIQSGIDIRPSLSITRAHLKIAELDDAVRAGRLKVDGKIVLPSAAATAAQEVNDAVGDKLNAGAEATLQHMQDQAGVEVNVSKVAFEHVWYLPGVAQRLNVSESLLRRCLFEDTGGMYPELLTRPDLKCFFPPIGGGTCYIFGPPSYLSDPSKRLAARVHDACSGSDIFGSDICTCRPYLLHGIEEAIKCAQTGGVGLIVYYQKEGRALGEVTKYLVYNARKRGGDEASQYFARTENIAGVKDMRFQAFMPDILLWLGVTKIDDLYSMSDMKYDSLVRAGITVHNRHDIPDYLIPPDSAVEIQAKIAHGYFSSKGVVTAEDLKKTVGRTWEELEH